MSGRIVFHIDVNSAFLSWEAVQRLKEGETLDLRTVPSIVGGDPKTRRGIVLAKSYPCKPYNIKTGESVHAALQKYRELVIVPPRYAVYEAASHAMIELAQSYSDIIQQYSIDEFFIDYTNMASYLGDPYKAADRLREQIKRDLGFTVCVGISSNKLLAKMATDLRKPDFTNTLFPNELEKMWQLPVEDLFMVGRATAPKLHRIGMHTIGDLAKADPKLLRMYFKSYGNMLWQYANGIEDSRVVATGHGAKGIGNSTTLPADVTTKEKASLVLLSLCEMVGMRMRKHAYEASLVAVGIRTKDFENYSHQRKLLTPTDNTTDLYHYARDIFQEAWKGEPIRHLSVRVSEFTDRDARQMSLFDGADANRKKTLDQTIDSLRDRYGNKAVVRASFLKTDTKPITGGSGQEHVMMKCKF